MKTGHARAGKFRRVGENLYRYSSNGRYYGVFRLHGKLIWKSLQTDDRELAKRKLSEEIKKAGTVDPKQSKATLEEILRVYQESNAKFAPKTQATRTSILGVFKATWKGGLSISAKDINRAHLELWLASHRQRLRKSSFNEYVRFIRDVFEVAVRLKAIPESPAKDIKELKREKPVRQTPTMEQFHSIVADIRAQRLNADAQDSADLVEFMGLGGVGTAECANLFGEHIDLANSRISLYRRKTDTAYTIPIFPQLLPLLQKLKDQGRIKNGEKVFKIQVPKKSLQGACERLDYPHFSPRALRRCFITRAVELGIDFKTIASWQGHQDGGVLIARTYSHLRNEHSDAMAQRLVAL